MRRERRRIGPSVSFPPTRARTRGRISPKASRTIFTWSTRSKPGKIKEKWGQLTDDDLTLVNGKREQLEGKIQERYGLAKDRVRQDVDDWLKTLN